MQRGASFEHIVFDARDIISESDCRQVFASLKNSYAESAYAVTESYGLQSRAIEKCIFCNRCQIYIRIHITDRGAGQCSAIFERLESDCFDACRNGKILQTLASAESIFSDSRNALLESDALQIFAICKGVVSDLCYACRNINASEIRVVFKSVVGDGRYGRALINRRDSNRCVEAGAVSRYGICTVGILGVRQTDGIQEFFLYGLFTNGTSSASESRSCSCHFAVNGPVVDLMTICRSKFNIAIGTYGWSCTGCDTAGSVTFRGCDLEFTNGTYGGLGTRRGAVRDMSCCCR